MTGATTDQDRPRLLYVSDSLGTPIHPRGIYNYSISLVEMLKSLGFSISLLVERAKGYGIDRDAFLAGSSMSKEALDRAEAADVYRYFHSEQFGAPNRFANKRLQQLTRSDPDKARQILARSEASGRQVRVLPNAPDTVDFVPWDSHAHLRMFDAFVTADRVYSHSMTRAFNGMPPIPIDATGFDAVIMDTPHNFHITGIAPSRTFGVVHDLIPISDPYMVQEWRMLFLMKLESTIAQGGGLIFVSETTKQAFRDLFPRHQASSETVIYPTIRSTLLQESSAGARRGYSDYMKRIAAAKPGEHIRSINARLDRLGLERNAANYKMVDKDFDNWNDGLPYFATTLSDEPRKNVKALVDLSTRLVGKANVVVMGQINGNHYMKQEPELYPNLHFTGYVSDVQKIDVLRYAAGLIFPSFSEGFGIPLVEGALFGAPVLCSDLPVFREITQGMALLFDPSKPSDIAAKALDILAAGPRHRATATRLLQSIRSRFTADVMRERLHAMLQTGGVPMQRAEAA